MSRLGACDARCADFPQSVVDNLLARTGRMCVVCKRLHGVQVHHILPRSQGGSGEADNAVPLCPNCHSEVHASYAIGRTTCSYTATQLRLLREQTITRATGQANLARGNSDWNSDVELIQFYSDCLDRPAFRTPFHNELSFAEFDQALEDTVLAISTGLSRTRDGAVIERSAGKNRLVNPAWRDRMDEVLAAIMQARHGLREALDLDRMLMHLDGTRSTESLRHPQRVTGGAAAQPAVPGDCDPISAHLLAMRRQRLRADVDLGAAMDHLRQRAIDALNEILVDAGLPILKGIGEWT